MDCKCSPYPKLVLGQTLAKWGAGHADNAVFQNEPTHASRNFSYPRTGTEYCELVRADFADRENECPEHFAPGQVKGVRLI